MNNKRMNLLIDLICLKIEFCEKQLNILYSNKPIFFQKKRIEDYNKKIEKCENRIIDLYRQLEGEIDCIIRMEKIY